MYIYVSALTIEVGRAHKRDVHAQIPVVGGAVETEVDAKGDRGPSRVLRAAVEADLVGFLALELLKHPVRFAFGSESHVGSIRVFEVEGGSPVTVKI